MSKTEALFNMATNAVLAIFITLAISLGVAVLSTPFTTFEHVVLLQLQMATLFLSSIYFTLATRKTDPSPTKLPPGEG